MKIEERTSLGTSIFTISIPVGQVFSGKFRGTESLWLRCSHIAGRERDSKDRSFVDLRTMEVYKNVTETEIVDFYRPHDNATLVVG